jgi:hypothetical protein
MDSGLSRPIESFEQLIENGIGTGETKHLFGRGNYVQFRERGLYLGVANRALPRQERAHSSELKVKRHHVSGERPDRGNQIGDDFTLIHAECHGHSVSNRSATDPATILSRLLTSRSFPGPHPAALATGGSNLPSAIVRILG